MAPNGEAPARPTSIAGEWLGRHSRRLIGAVGLLKREGADAGPFEAIALGDQLGFRRNAAQHQMGWLARRVLGKMDASLEGGVRSLD